MGAADPPAELLVDFQLDGMVSVVTVIGEVDIATCGSLREGLLRVLADEPNGGLVVNLADVSFIDSTGLGVLVGIWHRTQATPGFFALAAPSRQVQGILSSSGLTEVFPTYATQAEAVQACRGTDGNADTDASK
jgi:anti-sigma B factor antagonist